MFVAVLKSVSALFAALVVAMALIVGVEAIGAVMHPFPAECDPTDREACLAHVANFPTAALAMAVAGWTLTAFASCWVATRLGAGRHPAHGIAIGLLLFTAATFNMLMLPYPLWFEVSIWLLIPAALVAAVLGARQRRPVPSVPV